MKKFKRVESNHEALKIAQEYARNNDVNESRAEAIAEVWFDAGHDYDQESPEFLIRHLDRAFGK